MVVVMVVNMTRAPDGMTTITASANILKALEAPVADSIVVKFEVQILIVMLTRYVHELFPWAWGVRISTVPQILGRRRPRAFAHGPTNGELGLTPLPPRRRVPLASRGTSDATETLRAGKKVRLGRGCIVIVVVVLEMTLTRKRTRRHGDWDAFHTRRGGWKRAWPREEIFQCL